jgi:YVTN family beta-propeller protein
MKGIRIGVTITLVLAVVLSGLALAGQTNGKLVSPTGSAHSNTSQVKAQLAHSMLSFLANYLNSSIPGRTETPTTSGSHTSVVSSADSAGSSERRATPSYIAYSEQTLSLINNTLLPGNGPTANVASATYFAYDAVTHQVLVQGIYDSTIVTVNATTDTVQGGFPAARLGNYFGNGMAIDPSTGLAWEANQGSDVEVANPITDAVLAQIGVGSVPIAIAIDDISHQAFIANEGSSNVSVIDTQTLKVVATLPCGKNPETVAFVPETDTVYVGNWGSGNVTMFNGTTLANAGSFASVSRPQQPVFDPDNHDLYFMGEYGGGTTVFNTSTGLVAATISTGPYGVAGAFDPINGRVFLLDQSDLTILNGSTNALVNTVGIGSAGSSLVWDPSDHEVFTTDGTSPGTISVLNDTTGNLVTSWDDGGTPDGIIYNPERQEVDIANQGVGNISVVDSTSNSVVRYILVSYLPFISGAGPVNGQVFVGGACPGGLAELNATTEIIGSCISFPGKAVDPVYDPSNHLLYVSDGYEWVQVINVSRDVIVSSIFIGDSPYWAGPWEMSIDPRNNTLFVANTDWTNVSVISLSTDRLVASVNAGAEAALYDPADNSEWLSAFVSPGYVYRFNASTYAPLAKVSVGSYPDQMLYDPFTHTVYVANSGSGSVSVLNATTSSLVTNFSVGAGAYALGLDPNDGLVLCTSAWSNDVTVIDARTNTFLMTLPAGSWPRSVTFSVKGDFAAVPDQNSGSINIYRFHSIPGPKIESFTADPPTFPLGNTTNLTATVLDTSGVPSYAYSGLPPGCKSSNVSTMLCTPTVAGTFTIALNVTDSAGFWSVSSLKINVTGPLIVSASGSPLSGTVPLDVSFTGVVFGGTPPYRYSWEYGDGSLGSTSSSPSHTYNSTGTFQANLTVVDSKGAVAIRSLNITVKPAGLPLSATISATPSSGNAPLSVTFSSTVSGGVSPYVNAWNFGDGSVGSTSPSPSHTYNGTGTFEVEFTVTDNIGATSTRFTNITVVSPVSPLAATISATPLSGNVPLKVSFTSSTSGGSPPITFTWGFGDGSGGSTAANLSHTYNTSGSFQVKFSAHDSADHSAVRWTNVTASTPGTPFSASVASNVTSGTVPFVVSFTATASGGTSPYTFDWSFGDETVGSGAAITHAYTTAGVFQVQMTASDSASHTAVKWLNITASPGSKPLAVTLSANPLTFYLGNSTNLSATATGGKGAYTFSWPILPTGCSSAGSSTLRCTPTATGKLSVEVTVVDGQGAMVGAWTNLTVLPPVEKGTSCCGGFSVFGLDPTMSILLLVAIAAVVIVVMVAVVVVLRKKNDGTGPPSEPPTVQAGPPGPPPYIPPFG